MIRWRGCLCFVLVALALPATAQATSPDCPDQTLSQIGTNGQEHELRALRIDTASICAVAKYATDLAHADTGDVRDTLSGKLGTVASLLLAQTADQNDRLDAVKATLVTTEAEKLTALTQLHDDLGQLHDDLQSLPGGADQSAALAQLHADLVTAAANVDAMGEALKEALWFLIGVAASALAGYGLYRLVMPRG